MKAVPFLDLLDQEQEELLAHVMSSTDTQSSDAVMESTRRRLSVAIDSFVRSLPTIVRNDAATARAAAYALVGLADERIIHHPAGGLSRWGEKLLEFDLYGSALAGQEIVKRARQAAGSGRSAEETGDSSMLAPLYLAIFRAGFEGSLRGDSIGLTSLLAALEENVGTTRGRTTEIVSEQRPSRVGLAPLPFAILGIAVWLVSGLGWGVLMAEPFARADVLNERLSRGLPILLDREPLDRNVGPSGLPPLSGVEGKFSELAARENLSDASMDIRSSSRKEDGGSSWLGLSASEIEVGQRGSFSDPLSGRTATRFSSTMGISLASLPPSLFSVQLIAMRTEQAMNDYLAREGINNFPVVVLEYQGELFYVLVGGVYQTRQEAEEASYRAAESYGGVSPWIDTLGSVQQAMARAEQAALDNS